MHITSIDVRADAPRRGFGRALLGRMLEDVLAMEATLGQGDGREAPGGNRRLS